ncbi:MAG: carbohydrate kinase [Bacteroidetes bacterium]|nr:carbohydrate kinase [Bacteroidota bacterium]
MKNRRIYAIGETVYDIIFKDGSPIAAKPGGAMLNTSVSLGRLGLPVSFISELADDDVGKLILNFLEENNVESDLIYQYEKGKTAIALAFLDMDNEAHYNFYKQYPINRMKMEKPEFRPDDIVLFGSFAAITKQLREPILQILKAAAAAGSIIIYDPNFRKPHLKDLAGLKPFIIENIGYADIVRGSSDDFRLIFNAWNANEAYHHIQDAGCQILISTSAHDPVQLKTNGFHINLETPVINPVSTIGAGDAFNAGLIYGLMKLNIAKNDLDSLKKQAWETLLDIGIAFGSKVCESYDNYISQAFAARLKI